MKECPVCAATLPDPLPPCCPREGCGWDLVNDLTLHLSLNIPDRILKDYTQRVEIARKKWTERLEIIRKQKELEAEIRRLRTEREEAENRSAEEDRFWEEVITKDCKEGYEFYLRSYPDGRYSSQASARIQKIELRENVSPEDRFWQAVLEEDVAGGYEEYLRRYTSGKYTHLARTGLVRKEDNDWASAEAANTLLSYEKYLKQYPSGRFVSHAQTRLRRKQDFWEECRRHLATRFCRASQEELDSEVHNIRRKMKMHLMLKSETEINALREQLEREMPSSHGRDDAREQESIGIDLGTSRLVAARIVEGRPEVFNSIPSAVAYTRDGALLVGQEALNQVYTNPENTFYSVKRLIDCGYDEIEKRLPFMTYTTLLGITGEVDIHCPAMNRQFSPQEILARGLRKLMEGRNADVGVITIPCGANFFQRQAVMDAARIAGLKVNKIKIISHPTAAALYYGMFERENKNIVVLNLGAGTYDVCALEIGDGFLEVKANGWHHDLGGEDFDQCVIDWLAAEFEAEYGIDLRKDRMALLRLKEAAEKAKIELSSTMRTEINLPWITADASGPKHMNIKLTRAKLESLVEDLIDRLWLPMKQAWRDAGLMRDAIDEVILVGGMTRMPRVQQKVEEFFRKELRWRVNPDEVAALGAAIEAGALKGEVKDILILGATPLSLGIETLGGVMTLLIESGTAIPTRKSQIFTTSEDRQSAMEIHVLEGEDKPSDGYSPCHCLEILRLDDVQPSSKGVPQIEVTIDIDANNTISVGAKDLATDKAVESQISGDVPHVELARIYSGASRMMPKEMDY